MVGFYNYTVILTYIGLASSVLGITLAMEGRSLAACYCLLVSGLCDMFDGRVARTKKDRTEEEKMFGIQIDSLCDLVCFNVLPVVIGRSLGANAVWQLLIGVLFVLVGVIRLGYFNVIETTRQKESDGGRKVYPGFPVTSSALLVPLIMCFSDLLGENTGLVYSLGLLVLGILEIVAVPVKKPGKTGKAVFILAGIAIIVRLILL